MSFATILGTLNNLSNGTQVSEITKNPIPKTENTYKDRNVDNYPGYGTNNEITLSESDPEQTNAKADEHRQSKGNLIFSVPNWGYKDYIYERTSWQKGFDSITSDPGWFYFKIFFKFDTGHGLLGDILTVKDDINLDDEDDFGTLFNLDPFNSKMSHDTAWGYLYNMMDLHQRTGTIGKNKSSISPYHDRIISLSKFVKTLHYINSRAPWFFKGINGLDQVFMVENLNNPMPADRKIDLVMREDAVDTRVTTLFELYKYAAYDYINMKEILPENLRQFDMIIVLFHTPLKYWHTGIQTMRRGTFEYKDLYSDNADQRMSYKLFTFHGCEFVPSSLNSIYPSNISNEEPFQLAKDATISIKFKRVYQHTFNEWGRFMIGDDGVYVQAPDGTMTMRQKAISDAYENPYYSNPSADVFKALVDASEQKITYAMRMIDPSTVFGNLYFDYTNTKGKYFKDKIKNLKQGSKELNKGVR